MSVKVPFLKLYHIKKAAQASSVFARVGDSSTLANAETSSFPAW